MCTTLTEEPSCVCRVARYCLLPPNRSATVRRFAAGPAFALIVCGCADPNVYGTPRTTPEGETHGSLALEAIVAERKGADVVTTPTLPTYTLRYGAWSATDLGFRFANLNSLAFDLKRTLLLGRIDLALDPMVQWFGGLDADLPAPRFHVHVPLLVGFNLSRWLSIVASPGAAVAFGVGSEATALTERARREGETGAFARLGVGLNIRLSESIALQPEVTGMQHLGDSGITLWTAGFAVLQGALPRYDDIQ